MKRTGIVRLLPMLILFMFCICALITLLAGVQVYRGSSERTAKHQGEIVPISFIVNQVHQNDRADSVSIREEEGTQVLVFSKENGGTTYETKIYTLNGKLMSLYSDPADGLSLASGEEIVHCGAVSFELEGSLLRVRVEGQGEISIALRSAAAAEAEGGILIVSDMLAGTGGAA